MKGKNQFFFSPFFAVPSCIDFRGIASHPTRPSILSPSHIQYLISSLIPHRIPAAGGAQREMSDHW